MLAYPNQLPALQKAYKYSYGLIVTTKQLQRANNLKVNEFRPGVFQVGASIVDLWRMSCTCATMRQRKQAGIAPAVKPCPHFLALHLALKWGCYDPDPVKYLRDAGIPQPQIRAVYCSLRFLPGLYRLECSQYGDDRRHVIPITPNADQAICDVTIDSVIKVVPFYA